MSSPLVDQGHSALRDWFRKVWQVRGGGLYACGFAVTFIFLEIGSLKEDLAGVGAIFTGGAIDFAINFFLDFLVDSFMNTVAALMWPVDVVQWATPWGAIALGLGYWLFPTYVKPHIEGWLFDDKNETA